MSHPATGDWAIKMANIMQGDQGLADARTTGRVSDGPLLLMFSCYSDETIVGQRLRAYTLQVGILSSGWVAIGWVVAMASIVS